MKHVRASPSISVTSALLALLVIAVAGCPATEPQSEEKGRVTIVLSSDQAPFEDASLKVMIDEKARVVRTDELDSLVVTVEEILLERLTETGTETISVFSDPIVLNLLDLFGVFEVLDAADLPVGEYIEATLVLSAAQLVFSDAPETVIEDVVLLDGGTLTVPTSFENLPDGEALLVLDLGGIHLTELEGGGYQLVPDLLVDLVETNVQAQAIGRIQQIYSAYSTLTLQKHNATLEVDFTDAVIFLPEDFDLPSGTPEDLAVGQQVFVFGTLDFFGTLHASVIVILPDDRPGNSDRVQLKFWLEGTELQPQASGKVEYKAEHGRRWVDVKVQHLREMPEILVVMDDWLIDNLFVREGQARLRLDSREGHDVPELFRDSCIKILDAATNEVLLVSHLHEPGDHDHHDDQGHHDDHGHHDGDDGEEHDGDNDESEVHLRLSGTDLAPRAKGKLEYEAEDGKAELEVEVEDLSGVDAVDVVIDGLTVATLPVHGSKAKLKLKTQAGDTVPEVAPDSVVEIRNAEGGDVLLTSA